jgi:hypothetical protein
MTEEAKGGVEMGQQPVLPGKSTCGAKHGDGTWVDAAVAAALR